MINTSYSVVFFLSFRRANRVVSILCIVSYIKMIKYYSRDVMFDEASFINQQIAQFHDYYVQASQTNTKQNEIW